VSDITHIQTYISLICIYGAVCQFCVARFRFIICSFCFFNYATYVLILFMYVFLICMFVFYFAYSLFLYCFVYFLPVIIQLSLSYFVQVYWPLPPGVNPVTVNIWRTSHRSLNTLWYTRVSDNNPKHFERHVSNSAGSCSHV
jgi:hypothetical protein